MELLVIGEQDGSRSFGWILVLEVYCGLLQVKGCPLFKGDYVDFSAESSLGGGPRRIYSELKGFNSGWVLTIGIRALGYPIPSYYYLYLGVSSIYRVMV